MSDWHIINEAQSRRRNLQAEAEQHRLVQQVSGTRNNRPIHLMLAALGAHMVVWGEQLQQTHATREQVAVPRTKVRTEAI